MSKVISRERDLANKFRILVDIDDNDELEMLKFDHNPTDTELANVITKRKTIREQLRDQKQNFKNQIDDINSRITDLQTSKQELKSQLDALT